MSLRAIVSYEVHDVQRVLSIRLFEGICAEVMGLRRWTQSRKSHCVLLKNSRTTAEVLFWARHYLRQQTFLLSAQDHEVQPSATAWVIESQVHIMEWSASASSIHCQTS